MSFDSGALAALAQRQQRVGQAFRDGHLAARAEILRWRTDGTPTNGQWVWRKDVVAHPVEYVRPDGTQDASFRMFEDGKLVRKPWTACAWCPIYRPVEGVGDKADLLAMLDHAVLRDEVVLELLARLKRYEDAQASTPATP